jgi:hypothetical protein
MMGWLAEAMSAYASTVETACEMALQDGRYGVLVRLTMTDSGVVIDAGPDPSVPYGHIHERWET